MALSSIPTHLYEGRAKMTERLRQVPRVVIQPMRTDDIHPGDLIAGKYRVRAILGRKHGLLVDAFHTEFDQRVVIKLLMAGYGDDKEIERFRREARTLSKLESEHAARIIDVGTQQDGSFYLVRQFLEGADVESHVRQGGPLQLHEAVLYVLQAAEAVAETHGHGIIVREIEPRHLFLTSRAGSPCVKIVDFGTAKLMREAAAPTAGGDLTATAMFGMSPYSSPELIRKAKNVDQRTDVWSLGACLYYMLTGQPPFLGETAMLMLAIAREEPTPATHLRPDLPPEIDSIIGWALAKDLDARFRNVHALAHALMPYANAEGQVLIERIGRMSEGARSRRGSAPPPPSGHHIPAPPASGPYDVRPSSPPSSAKNLDFDDSVTQFRPPPSQRSVAPVPPVSTRGLQSVPPPAPPPSSRAPISAHPIPEGPPSVAPPGSVQLASSVYPIAPVASQRQLPLGRRMALGSLAAAAVLLPLFIALLFLRGGAQGGDLRGVDNRVPGRADNAMDPVQQPRATATLLAPPEQPAQPQPAAAPTAAVAEPAKPKAAASPDKAPAPKKDPAPIVPPPQAQPEPPPQPAASGSMGTLVAVATGGSCAFSVNGAGKGSGSSVRVQLKPGTYSVTCKASTGSSKSRSVNVKGGETAMVSFKL